MTDPELLPDDRPGSTPPARAHALGRELARAGKRDLLAKLTFLDCMLSRRIQSLAQLSEAETEYVIGKLTTPSGDTP